MSKRLKRKVVLMIAVELVFLAILGVFLTNMQTNLSLEDQRGNIEVKLSEMSGLLESADASAAEITQNFDEVHQGKVGSVAFMFQNGVMEKYDSASMQEAKQLLQVDNVLILDREGKALAKAQKTPADFTRSRFNQLRAVFETGEPSEAFEVKIGDKRNRYYGAKIDDKTMAVVETSPQALEEQLDAVSTWKSILSKVTVGLDGYAFAVSAKDYTFLYYPEEELVGKDAIAAGIEAEDLHDGDCTWMTVNGKQIYGGVTEVEDVYVVCAVNAEEILASRNTTVMIVLFAIFVVLTLVITYAFFLINEGKDDEVKHLFGNIYYGKSVSKKIEIVSLVGLVCILLVSFYMQTIFSLSRQSMSNSQRVAEVETIMDSYNSEVDELTEEYNARYLNKAQIAAYIIDKKPELAQREKLAELSEILVLESVNVFDARGVQIATNSPYTVFTLSKEPEDQSYPFWTLLQGVEYLVQEARYDDVSGDLHQYVGVTIRDENAIPTGFVQISVIPSRLEETVTDMQIDKILPGIKVGNNGIVFAVNKADGTFAWHPSEKMIGRVAETYGLTAAQQVDEYVGYFTMSGTKYYGSALEVGDYYIYAAVPDSEVGGKRLPITVAAGVATLIALLIVIVMLTVFRGEKTLEEEHSEKKHRDSVVDVTMPDGTTKKSSSAASRWTNSFVGWHNKTAEQKFMAVLRILMGLFAVGISIAIVMKDQFFDSNSVFLFVLSGKWARGLNIFALTGCLLIICVITVISMVLQRILSAIARAAGAKGETICRLLKSLTKYISMIAMLYYCLALIGIDTATLLASAGILTLIVGLGAQTLVSDILAGLFIIFEGEFQVGDIVTIGDWRGTVVEIGVRTTKIQDGSMNIKVISNSAVSGVINMTRDYSFCSVDVGIEYGESLERVENVLEQEFPNIRAHLPAIVDGPFYKGVVALADNSVNLRIVVLCAEADRFQMERDLNREMKLIFDKHEINVPFPQIVLNQPVEFKQATEWEKMKARAFTEKQKELASNLMIEEENEER